MQANSAIPGWPLRFVLEEFPRQLEVHVGLEEDATHLAEAILDVGLAQDTATTKSRENPFQIFGELLEHRPAS